MEPGITTYNTLGGFDPLDQIRHVAQCIHKGDLLIIDAHLETGLTQPSEEQKRFVFAPLAATGVIADDGELEFMENLCVCWFQGAFQGAAHGARRCSGQQVQGRIQEVLL